MLDQIIKYIGTTKFRFTAVLFIILSVILLTDKIINNTAQHNKNYICPREKMDTAVSKIVEDQERKLHDRLWISCKDGLIKGGITGGLTGGFIGAVYGSTIFAIANPIILYINEYFNSN
jgi:hypothetical protein